MTTTTNRAAGTRQHGGMDDTTDPDPEVPERARGPRRFPAAYKARILAEYEGLSKADKGALLRREGLYSSLITEWRKQADQGAHEALGRSAGRQSPLTMPRTKPSNPPITNPFRARTELIATA